MMGARCWVDNAKFWVAQCDLLEKMLIAMDREGIALAFRRQAVRLFHENALQVERMDRVQNPTVPATSHEGPNANAMSAVSTEDLDA
jgi:hypothetical protein